jgi:hypothetical protein
MGAYVGRTGVKHNPSRSKDKRRAGSLLLGWLILLLLIAALAHADNSGFHYEHWQDTNGWHDQTR